MKKLFLLRHAETLPGDPGGSDRDRRLTPQGEEDAAALGRYMKQHHYIPDIVFCSPATRTQQTLECVLQSFDVKMVDYPGKIYDGSMNNLLMMIQSADDEFESLLLVGHNPVIHQLAAKMAAERSAAAQMNRLAAGYAPGTLCVYLCPRARWMDVQPGENVLTHLAAPGDYNPLRNK